MVFSFDLLFLQVCRFYFHLLYFSCRFVDFQGMESLLKEYRAEVIKNRKFSVSETYFRKLWQQALVEGVVDPKDGVHYCACVRKKHCRGFGLCNFCELMKSLAAISKKPETRDSYRRQHRQHLHEVHDDRCELARLAR